MNDKAQRSICACVHLRTILRSVAVRVRVVSQLSKLELVTVVTHKCIVLQEQAEKERVFDGYYPA